MKPFHIATHLFLLATLAACGDSGAPNGKADTAQAESPAQAANNPADILAALPPEDQPYGLDVYSAKCVQCHGALGQGVDNAPALTGLTRSAMQQKMLAYRAGQTLGPQTAVMAEAVAGLSDAEIAAVSIYAGE
ncbi:MAG: c-type cytochrome [Thiobacillus sp.]